MLTPTQRTIGMRAGSSRAVFAHGALNASAGMSAWFILAGTTTDPLLSSPLGITGWIVAGVVILALLVTGQFRPRSREVVDGPRGSAERPRGGAG